MQREKNIKNREFEERKKILKIENLKRKKILKIENLKREKNISDLENFLKLKLSFFFPKNERFNITHYDKLSFF